MDNKKISWLAHTGIVVVILIMWYLLNNQQNLSLEANNNASVISRSELGENTDSNSVYSPKVVSVDSIFSTKQQLSEIQNDSNKLSYTEVYQHLQSARACQTFYRFWREQGISADVSKRVARQHYFHGQQVYAGTEQPPLTVEQHQTLEYWIDECVQTWVDYGVFDNGEKTAIPLNDVLDAISKKLLTITPKTKKEQKLKKMRRLLAQWLSSYQGLEATYEGEDTLDSTTAQALYDELESLRSLDQEVKEQWFAAQSNSTQDEETFRDQHFDLLKKIRALEFQIKDQKQVNQASLNQALANFQGYDQAVNEAIRTQYADVFFEYIYAFNGKESAFFQYLGFEYSSPINSSQPASQHRISP